MKKRVLISWIAFKNDFSSETNDVKLDGPHGELHNHFYKDDLYFKHIILSTSSSAQNSRASQLASFIKSRFNRVVEVEYLGIDDIISIEEIKPKVSFLLLGLLKKYGGIDIFISPGTPAMQVVWYLLYWELGELGNDLRIFQTKKSQLSKDKKPVQTFIDIDVSPIPQTMQLKQVASFVGNNGGLVIGKDIKPTYDLALKVANTDKVSVVILGETGVGKERLSKFIHDNSVRKGKAFIPVNCGAIPNELIESELFGHVKGAFTSAHKDKIGKFELAHKGTIFLDEIGDMPLNAQTRLLRVLQPKQAINKVGSEKAVDIDVRVIAATNMDLKQLCEEKLFRYDLYYRLNVVEITIAPLRLRPNDLKELLHHFINVKADYFGKKKLEITKEAEKVILNYPFLGNTRQLINLVENLYIFSDKTITVSNLPSFLFMDQSDNPMSLKSVQNRHVRIVLSMNNGNKTKTAKTLGITVNTLKTYL